MGNFTAVFRVVGIIFFIAVVVIALQAIREYAPDIISNCNHNYEYNRTLSRDVVSNQTRIQSEFLEERIENIVTSTSADLGCVGLEIKTETDVYFICNDGTVYVRQDICKGHSFKGLSNTTQEVKNRIKALDQFQKTQYLNSSSP